MRRSSGRNERRRRWTDELAFLQWHKFRRCPMPDSGVSTSEEVTLLAIHGNGARDRNIHPRGRETIGDRCNYSAQRAPFLPVAHAVARAISLSLSRSHSISSTPLPIASPPLILLPPIFFFSHWRGRDTYASPFRIPHMRRINPHLFLSLFLSLSTPHLHPSIRSPGYTGRPSSPWPPSPSPFFGALPPRSLASAGNSARRSPRRIVREHGIPPFLQCPVILKNTPAK